MLTTSSKDIFDFETIAIVGLGLLGGSLALSLQNLKENNSNLKIWGADLNQRVSAQAAEKGIVDKSFFTADLHKESFLQSLDLLIFAVPVNGIKSILQGFFSADYWRESNCTVTDVGSTKSEICSIAWSQKYGHHFIGSHPMAGKENSGLDYASSDLYRGATIFCCSQRAGQGGHSNKNQMLQMDKAFDTEINFRSHETHHKEKVKKFWQALGARTSEIDPDYHDQVVAHTSHLPHLLSMALMSNLGNNSFLNQALFLEQKKWFGGGLVDFTRIAASSPAMWVDIFEQNGKALLEALDSYLEEIVRLKDYISRGDRDQIVAFLENSAALRRKMVPDKSRSDEESEN